MQLAFFLSDWFHSLDGWLQDFATSPWLPLVIFSVALLDSIVPIVPGETMVIIGGVAAGAGDQQIAVVILAGASGAFIGDNLAYILGRKAAGFLRRTLLRGESGAARLRWADRQLERRGGMLLITARFIPGGRTAVTISSGITHRPHRWFMGYAGIAALIWASYAGLLGFFGGKAFEDNHTVAFIFAFGAALGITGIVEVVRWRRNKGSGVVGHG